MQQLAYLTSAAVNRGLALVMRRVTTQVALCMQSLPACFELLDVWKASMHNHPASHVFVDSARDTPT